MRKILLALISVTVFTGCFSTTKSALSELVKGAKSQCPIAGSKTYNILDDKKTNLGSAKFGAGAIAGTKDTECYLLKANGLSPTIGGQIKNFVARSFYKINDELYIAYLTPLSEKPNLYFIESTKNGGWNIYGSCKKASKDCEPATSKQAIMSFAKDLPNQTPSYILEVAK